VRGDIPRFVSGSGYAAAFGLQWRRYRETQLDSYTGTTISRDRARRCLGEALWSSLGRLRVLEVGCGAGRFTEVLLDRGAFVASVDLSDAVDANSENFPPSETHRVAQADVMRLPFAPREFDIVFCLGVVQHTPDPEAAIGTLFDHVRPGGTLVFDHYATPLSWRLSTAPLARAVLRRLEPTKALRITERLVDLLLPVHRAAGRFGPIVTRLSPVYAYYHVLPQLPERLQREWALLDTHDALTDRYKHFRTPERLDAALRALGADVDRCERSGNGVEVRARRPAPGI